jgi:nucleotidyltransferase substrate binding protein (TIGR01987 family)
MTAASLENAESALGALTSFLSQPVSTDRDRAGVIQAFEFTFEAVWKLLKAVAEREGLAAESPRRAIVAAYKLGLIDDETLWIGMLTDRNLTSHTYHQQVAQRIFEAVRSVYAAALSAAVAACRALPA